MFGDTQHVSLDAQVIVIFELITVPLLSLSSLHNESELNFSLSLKYLDSYGMVNKDTILSIKV